MKNIKRLCLLALCIVCFSTARSQTVATYYTSMGKFKTTLTDTLTPRTVDSFIARVLDRFYDGLIFHRVIAGFMIQGGDPLGTGFGGPGYTTPDEFHSSLTNIPGALAMANSGPNTNGSQFYINLVTNSHLNGGYTVFGMTTDSFSVVQAIGLVPVNSTNRPITPVVMDSVRITSLYSASVRNTGKGVSAGIYPNPNRGSFTVDLPAIATKVQIVNIAGSVVYTNEAKGKLAVDLGNQPAGLYFVQLSNINGTAQSKVIVQ